MNTRIVERSINQIIIAGVILICAFLWVYPSYATPPHYKSFHRELVIDNKDELQSAFEEGLLHGIYGIYEELAEAVLTKEEPGGVRRFDRIWEDKILVHDADGIAFKVIWSQKTLRSYESRDWGKTINGNGVTFVLEYGDFKLDSAMDCPFAKTMASANIKTWLKRMDDEQYAVCDAAVRKHVQCDLPAPSGFPYPQAVI